MFKYTSTTILNSDKDVRSDKAMFSSVSADDKHGAILKIKRDYTFEMPGITKVYKRVAATPVMAQITVDCSELIAAIPSDALYPVTGRLSFYIMLEGSEESVFSNDFYQKGVPFSVGFTVDSADMAGSDLATQISKAIVKYNIGVLGRQIFTVETSGSTITVTCVGEFLRFKGIAALMDVPFRELELAHLYDTDTESTQNVFTLVERGTAGFGTFSQLLKDLRLPTEANTSWTAPYKSDKPIPGALYNQYIIYYAWPSGTNPSLVSVGHETLSKTTHVFWVNQTISDAFETCITEVVGSGPVKDDPTAPFEEV